MPQRCRLYGTKPRVLPVVPAIPSGAIIMIDPATPAPVDWQDYLSADGHYIIGAGLTYPAETLGDPQSEDIVLAEAGLHAEGTTHTWFTDRTSGSGKITQAATNVAEGSHSHTVNLKNNPDAANVKLIQATADTGIPTGGIVMTDGVVIGMDRASELDGGCLRADSTKTYGFEERGLLAEGPDEIMSHDHKSSDNNDGYSCSTPYNGWSVSSFPHGHAIAADGEARRLLLAAYKAASDLASVTGEVIVLYPAGTPPTGWVVCDGSNGTPNTLDEIVEFNSDGLGTVQGDNQFNFEGGETDTFFHNHENPTDNRQVAGCPLYHISDVGHSHIAPAWSGALVAKYFALQFIKYTG